MIKKHYRFYQKTNLNNPICVIEAKDLNECLDIITQTKPQLTPANIHIEEANL